MMSQVGAKYQVFYYYITLNQNSEAQRPPKNEKNTAECRYDDLTYKIVIEFTSKF
jgi:hypothetical protein